MITSIEKNILVLIICSFATRFQIFPSTWITYSIYLTSVWVPRQDKPTFSSRGSSEKCWVWLSSSVIRGTSWLAAECLIPWCKSPHHKLIRRKKKATCFFSLAVCFRGVGLKEWLFIGLPQFCWSLWFVFFETDCSWYRSGRTQEMPVAHNFTRFLHHPTNFHVIVFHSTLGAGSAGMPFCPSVKLQMKINWKWLQARVWLHALSTT